MGLEGLSFQNRYTLHLGIQWSGHRLSEHYGDVFVSQRLQWKKTLELGESNGKKDRSQYRKDQSIA